MSYKTLILSNLYGFGQSEDPSSSHLIGAIHNKFKVAMKSGSKSIEIWGSGHARREFTHVNDIAKWLAQNLHRISEFPQMLNLGYGSDFSINEFYQFFSVAYGGDFAFSHDLSKPEGMPAKLLDSRVAISNFAWTPLISPYDGIHKLVQDDS
jgi:GDP-L-fucose synthase